MSALYRLAYCSRSLLSHSDVVPKDEIEAILTVSRRNNFQHGITGALLFTAGCFVQMLEGEMGLIETTYERIQLDSRHDNVTILELGPCDQRIFGAWSMAFHGAPDDELAAATLGQAFGGEDAGAERVLTLLRDVANREREWAEMA